MAFSPVFTFRNVKNKKAHKSAIDMITYMTLSFQRTWLSEISRFSKMTSEGSDGSLTSSSIVLLTS